MSPSGVSIGAGLLLFVVLIILFRVFFPGALMTVTAPLLRAGASLTASVTSFRASFAERTVLVIERDQLRVQNTALINENSALTAKVDDLTRLLGHEPPEPLGIIASVLARPPVAGYDMLIVAAGASDGASSGMRVIALGGIPVGTVESVTQNYSRITLFSAPGKELASWIGDARLAVTLTGSGGGAFTGAAPKAAGIVEGDIVYTAGPGALPIGRVIRVDTNLSSPSATLLIAPTVNPFSIVWVKLVP